MNANPLETLLTEMNAPVAFTGFLVALLILSPEGLGALKAVLNNQVQRAMNLFFGSVLATISLTVPVVRLRTKSDTAAVTLPSQSSPAPPAQTAARYRS